MELQLKSSNIKESVSTSPKSHFSKRELEIEEIENAKVEGLIRLN